MLLEIKRLRPGFLKRVHENLTINPDGHRCPICRKLKIEFIDPRPGTITLLDCKCERHLHELREVYALGREAHSSDLDKMEKGFKISNYFVFKNCKFLLDMKNEIMRIENIIDNNWRLDSNIASIL